MITPLFVTSVTKNRGEDRVRDHRHLSGKFRGAAHEVCNLTFKVPKFFPVVFHNLYCYDYQQFFKTLGNSEGDISCIQVMRKTTFHSRNKSSLTNLLITKEHR